MSLVSESHCELPFLFLCSSLSTIPHKYPNAPSIFQTSSSHQQTIVRPLPSSQTKDDIQQPKSETRSLGIKQQQAKQERSPKMTAPNAGCSSWGPDTQQLSLQVNITPSTTCANIRYMFTGCLHILLLRCPIHPVSQATGEYGSPQTNPAKPSSTPVPTPKPPSQQSKPKAPVRCAPNKPKLA